MLPQPIERAVAPPFPYDPSSTIRMGSYSVTSASSSMSEMSLLIEFFGLLYALWLITFTACRVTTHGSLYASLEVAHADVHVHPDPKVQCAAQTTHRGAISVAPQK